LSGDFGPRSAPAGRWRREVGSAFGNTIILAIGACLLAFRLPSCLGTTAAYAKVRAVATGW
jgi:ABC-type dipeptide/oligopeptide/nickel transport system permease component